MDNPKIQAMLGLKTQNKDKQNTKTHLKSNMVLTNKLGVNTNFIFFGLTRPPKITTSMELNPRSTAMPLEANTLIITLPMRLLILHDMLRTKN